MRNIAHRGARSLAPENTLLAARLGLEAGADLWEADLAVTADEALILMHDPLLARTTDVARKFPSRARNPYATFTLEEIHSLDAGTWFLETDPFGQIAAGAVSDRIQRACRGEPVPTLEEALVFTRDARWALNLELKVLPPPLEKFPVVGRVLALVDRVGLPEESFILSSFHHPWLEEARALRPSLKVQALFGRSAPALRDRETAGFDAFNIDHTLVRDPDILRLKARGIAVNLFTVNDDADMRRYRDLGVDGLFTDFPQRLAALA